MQPPLNISELLLIALTENYSKWNTLEELSSIILSLSFKFITIQEKFLIEIENEAKVLDALIDLDNKGLVILNSITDESKIKIKGLINTKINDYLN